MNILVDIIPQRFRRYVYALVALVGLTLGAAQTAGVDYLFGVSVATLLAVYSFVVTATGLMAYANTTPGALESATPTPQSETH